MARIKVCPNCGAHSHETDMFCVHCGSALSDVAVVDVNDMAATPSGSEPAPSASIPPVMETTPAEAPFPEPASQPAVTPHPSAPASAQQNAASPIPVPQPVYYIPPPPQYPETHNPPTSSSTCGKTVLGCLGALLVVAVIGSCIVSQSYSYQGMPLQYALSQWVQSFAGFFGGGLGIILLFGCSFAPFIFWMWMLVDCITNEPTNTNDKIIWIVVMLFTNFIGAFLYYIIRRPERQRFAALAR